MELYKHQKKFIELNPEKHLLCWEMGTAKSRAAIEWAKLQPNLRLLIICPKGLVSNWIRELEKWGLEEHMGKENFEKNVMIMSKETIRTEVKNGTIDLYNSVIVDEAHYFAGHTSQMSKALGSYVVAYEPKILLLTGTPFMSNALNVMRLGQILGRKDWTYWEFNKLFFNHVRMGSRIVPVQKQDFNSKQLLASMTKSLGSVVKMEDCVDVPSSNEYAEHLSMTSEQLKIQTKMELEFLPAITLYTKFHQLSGGTMVGDEFTPSKTEINSAKKNRLMDILEEKDKVIVVARYKLEIRMLYNAVKKKFGKDKFVYYITGDTPAEDRDAIIQKVRMLDNVVLIVNAALSEGWEAPEIETMVFYSHSWSLKDYLQMKARIQRINDLRHRTYIHLLVEGMTDEGVYKSLLNKNDFLIHIYANQKEI